jgi:hypothetical protein
VAYIGNDLQVAFSTYKNIDDISGSFDGVTTSFALLVNGVAPAPLPLNSNQCLISVGGVVQRPDDTGTEGFRLSGGNIVFSSAPNTAEDFFGVILAGADYVNAGANFPDGTLAAPSITFDQDNDTGYYRSGSGAVSFASNGVAAGTWSSAGVTAPALIPTGSSVPANGVYLPAANTVGVATNGTGRLFIDATGNVGVGTSVPEELVHIASISAGALVDVLKVDNQSGTTNSEVGIVFENGTDRTARISSANTGSDIGPLKFWTAGSVDTLTERMRITSSGNVGIGTTSPGVTLHLNATNPGIRLEDSDASGTPFAEIFGSSGNLILQADASAEIASSNIQFLVDGNEAARIDDSRRLLVGASAAVSGADANGRVQVSQDIASNTCILVVENTASSGNLSCIRARLRNYSPNNIYNAFLQCDDTSTGNTLTMVAVRLLCIAMTSGVLLTSLKNPIKKKR